MPLIYKLFLKYKEAKSVFRLPLLSRQQARSGKAFSAFLVAFLAATPGAARSDTAAAEHASAQFLKTPIEQYIKAQGWRSARYRLSFSLLGGAPVPSCSSALRASSEAQNDPLPARQRLYIDCNDAQPWRRSVQVSVEFLVKALHASREIERGSTLSAADLNAEEISITRSTKRFFQTPAELIGQGAKRRIREGQLIGENLLTAPLLVRRGQPVTIVASQHGINAQVAGLALANGSLGEVIRVRNVSSDKVIDAKVIEEGVVSTLLQ